MRPGLHDHSLESDESGHTPLSGSDKINLLELDRPAIEALFLELGSKAFHGRNVFKWIHKHGVTEFAAMTDISKRLREQLQQLTEVRLPELVCRARQSGRRREAQVPPRRAAVRR